MDHLLHDASGRKNDSVIRPLINCTHSSARSKGHCLAKSSITSFTMVGLEASGKFGKVATAGRFAYGTTIANQKKKRNTQKGKKEVPF